MNTSDLSRDTVLSALGLQRRRRGFEMMMPLAAYAGAGLLAGVALGLLFAPKAGSALRRDIGGRLHRAGGERQQQPGHEEMTSGLPSTH